MATDKEILEASSKNAQYILELEANIDELRNMLEQYVTTIDAVNKSHGLNYITTGGRALINKLRGNRDEGSK